jgi:pimeloyl-ACP methyl ester carboxylesterase
MPPPLLDLGGRGPLVHLAPANGFPPATYLPALTPILPRHRVVCLPPRAMWFPTPPVPDAPGEWDGLADDLLAGIEAHGLPPLLAIGHSFGAVATVIAAARAPARFRALALLDPTIFIPPVLDQIREQKRRGELASRPLAQGARKRRDRFESAQEAFAYWREKALFRDWSDDAVRRYAAAMLRPAPDGGFTLSWSPLWEAWYYESIHTETWSALARLPDTLPILVIGGERSDTFLPEARALLAGALPRGTHRVLPGHGHLFPHSAPEETGRMLSEWLSGLALPPR